MHTDSYDKTALLTPVEHNIYFKLQYKSQLRHFITCLLNNNTLKS